MSSAAAGPPDAPSARAAPPSAAGRLRVRTLLRIATRTASKQSLMRLGLAVIAVSPVSEKKTLFHVRRNSPSSSIGLEIIFLSVDRSRFAKIGFGKRLSGERD